MSDTKIQKIVNKLISEEIIAHDFYDGCLYAMKDNDDEVSKLFNEIAVDEKDDHAKSLVKWAKFNKFSVPCKYSEFEKYADEAVVLQFRRLKHDESLEYYVQLAIKSEEYAIKFYEDILKDEKLELPYELNAIIYKNFYDECEHLNKLSTLLLMVLVGVLMNIIQ